MPLVLSKFINQYYGHWIPTVIPFSRALPFIAFSLPPNSIFSAHHRHYLCVLFLSVLFFLLFRLNNLSLTSPSSLIHLRRLSHSLFFHFGFHHSRSRTATWRLICDSIFTGFLLFHYLLSWLSLAVYSLTSSPIPLSSFLTNKASVNIEDLHHQRERGEHSERSENWRTKTPGIQPRIIFVERISQPREGGKEFAFAPYLFIYPMQQVSGY